MKQYLRSPCSQGHGIRTGRGFSLFGSARLVVSLFAVILCAVGLSGETFSAKDALAVRKQTFQTSVSLFASQDYESAKSALVGGNVEKSGSLAWNLESACKLTQMALYFRSQHDYRTALTIANQALAMLQETVGAKMTTAASRKQRGQVYELAGFIYDDILHDLDSAKTNYQEALNIYPSSKRASDALLRIDSEEAKRRRIGGGE
jgi:tetratricopeptide (TPR) repeat protein